IVHSGALTEWGQPLERHQAINVAGTRRVIALAQVSGAPVHLVSTAFVHAIERGRLPALSPDNVVRSYISTKLESERLLAARTFRPTKMGGGPRTGASSRPQIVQTLSAWLCRGRAAYFPAHPGNVIDVAPMDVLAIAVARAVEADDLGQLYWITYGARAMTIGQMLEGAAAHARY